MNVQLDEGAYMPERAHDTDAGADLRTPYSFTLWPGEFECVDTGVHVEVPEGYMLEVRSKSGLMTKSGVVTDGTVDAGYNGSIRVCLFNHSRMHREFQAGDKIAQIVFLRIDTPEFEQVDQITGGERSDRGFGSTGR